MLLRGSNSSARSRRARSDECLIIVEAWHAQSLPPWTIAGSALVGLRASTSTIVCTSTCHQASAYRSSARLLPQLRRLDTMADIGSGTRSAPAVCRSTSWCSCRLFASQKQTGFRFLPVVWSGSSPDAAGRCWAIGPTPRRCSTPDRRRKRALRVRVRYPGRRRRFVWTLGGLKRWKPGRADASVRLTTYGNRQAEPRRGTAGSPGQHNL